MTPSTGSVRAQASPQPAGRPLTSTTFRPASDRLSRARIVWLRSLWPVVSVPSTSVKTLSTRDRSAARSGRGMGAR